MTNDLHDKIYLLAIRKYNADIVLFVAFWALGRRDIPAEPNQNIQEGTLEDNGYKIAMGRLVSPRPVQIIDEMAQDIAEKLLPRTVDERLDIPVKMEEEVRLFTEEEIHSAAESFENGKAPEPAGIPSEAMKVAVKAAPERILKVLNGLLRAEDFLTKWKLARLVVIPSDIWQAIEASSVAPNQHGLRKGHSTVDAVEAVMEIDTAPLAHIHSFIQDQEDDQSKMPILQRGRHTEYNLFHCPRWGDSRTELTQILGETINGDDDGVKGKLGKGTCHHQGDNGEEGGGREPPKA
ncbi:hypothetical protein JTB14_002097 [Gonioctena quinquepunctata]|nr:hypothetical protein JTB14_002097 [Gonioctena quinquepunctata]